MPASRPTRRQQHWRAFTLVELVVVVVILGLLAAVGMVAYNAVVKRSQDAAAQTALTSLGREAQALAALRSSGSLLAADFTAAAADMPTPGAGATAAGWAVDPRTGEYSRGPAKVHLALDGARAGLALAQDSRCTLAVVPTVGRIVAWTSAGDIGAGCTGTAALTSTPGSAPAWVDPALAGAPAAPGLPAAAAGTEPNTATLTWPASPEADVASYRVYLADTVLATVTGRTTTSAALTGVPAGGRQLSVSAVDTTGLESPRSVAVSVQTRPAAPTGVTAVATSGTSVTVGWNAVADASGYEVSRDGLVVGTTAGSQFADAVSPGSAYSYGVTALAAGGRSAASAPATVTTPSAFAAAVLATGPTNFWRLGERTGTTAVDAAGRSNGSYTGGVTLGQSSPLTRENTAAAPRLNGSTGQVGIGGTGADRFRAGLTVSAWVYPTANSNYSRIVEWGSGGVGTGTGATRNIAFARDAQTGGLAYFIAGADGAWLSDSYTVARNVMPLNTWTMVTLTVDASGVVKMYGNGAQLATTTPAAGFKPIPALVRDRGTLGMSINSTADPNWAGGLAEVGVWDRPLSATEVQSLYAAR